MSLFETLSSAFSPEVAKYVTEVRIKMIQERIKIYHELVFDLEKELETLKKQPNDTPKNNPHPASTIVIDDDYDMAHPV